jgi:hypothetical protein
MKITGIVLFWIGVVELLISLILFIINRGIFNEDLTGILIWFVNYLIAPTGFIFALTGAILYVVGKNRETMQRNLHEADDSQSE